MFKPITFDSKAIIESYTKDCDYLEHNSNIVNMLMWIETYRLYYYENKKFLIIYCNFEELKFYYVPFVKDMKYFNEAVEWIYNQDNKFQMFFVSEKAKDYLLKTNLKLKIEENRDGFDYIYDFDKLKTLSGKKMQKKRNHYNNFINNYEYKFEKLTNKHIDELHYFLDDWYKNHEQKDFFSDKEFLATHHLLRHLEKIDYLGGCIYIDNKIQAFCIASYLTKDMIQINIEKANTNYKGLYVAISKLFLESIEDENIIYVNREDDVGEDNLRKAKLANYPVMFIKKYNVRAEN